MKAITIVTICVLVTILSHAAEFATPVLLTSAGQSADPQMVKTLLTRDTIPFEFKPLATSEDLSSAKSVIIVLGGSSKGLGAAKVSADEESARISGLLTAAHENKLPVLAIHLGGKNRRGALSDAFNRIGAENSSEIVVVAGGDDDGFFKTIAEERKLPYAEAARIADLGPIIRSKFKPEVDIKKE